MVEDDDVSEEKIPKLKPCEVAEAHLRYCRALSAFSKVDGIQSLLLLLLNAT